MSVDWLGFGYALLVSAGGVVGYVKAGSVTSMVAGLVFGLLAAIGSNMTSHNPRNSWLLQGTAGTVAAVMGLRFLGSFKFMPAGLMTIASLLLLLKIFVGRSRLSSNNT
ncbi:transmembrane protein 14C-like [Salarias fasciatus]|uniref:Transmembrane protein 14C n=1 Tax=Salarias fasciatus TaxID=181472 RepID=A0A672HM92_SALFA|nr:transmembrane protein 14C-like [Salarias fasciatus]